MQPISSFLPSLPPASDLINLPARLRTSDVSKIKASTETHADLTVLTAGGDRVTLSTESLLRASYTTLNSQSSDPQLKANGYATALQVQQSNSITVSVEGQLNPEEEADVQRLVDKLQKVVKQFLGGDSEGALGQALHIGELGSVASFQLNVQESENIAVTEKQSSSGYALRASPPQSDTQDQKDATGLLTQILDSFKDTNIELSKLLKRLPQVLRQAFDQIEPKVSDNSLSELLSAVESALRPTPLPLDPANTSIATLV